MSPPSGLLGRLTSRITGSGNEQANSLLSGSGLLTNLQVPARVARGEPFTVKATVTNPRAQPYPQEVIAEHVVDGDIVDQRTLGPSDTTVKPGQQQPVRGTFTMGNRSGFIRLTLYNSRTGDRLDQRSQRVHPINPKGSIRQVTLPKRIPPGHAYEVAVDVQNTGNLDLQPVVTIRQQTPQGTQESTRTSPTQPLPPGATVTLKTTLEGQPEDQTIKVTLEDSEFHDSLDQATATIQASPITATLNVAGVPNQAGPEEVLDLTFTLKNTGQFPAPLRLHLEHGTPRHTLSSQDLRPTPTPLAPGQSTQATTSLRQNKHGSRIIATLVNQANQQVLDELHIEVPVEESTGTLSNIEHPGQAAPTTKFKVRAMVKNTSDFPIRARVTAHQTSGDKTVTTQTLAPANEDIPPDGTRFVAGQFEQPPGPSKIRLQLEDTIQGITLDDRSIMVTVTPIGA